jgi:hypothetical protein
MLTCADITVPDGTVSQLQYNELNGCYWPEADRVWFKFQKT